MPAEKDHNRDNISQLNRFTRRGFILKIPGLDYTDEFSITVNSDDGIDDGVNVKRGPGKNSGAPRF